MMIANENSGKNSQRQFWSFQTQFPGSATTDFDWGRKVKDSFKNKNKKWEIFRQATYTDNREIEGRIFHLAKQYGVPLFEKDQLVEKCIEGLYRVREFSKRVKSGVFFSFTEFQTLSPREDRIWQGQKGAIPYWNCASANQNALQ